ncbi:restriction endonuclease subunit S [Acinetobacter baumannii]|uniref:restriction endonuclease subunit S n=1 Tax=Acinetobacter baumannii TaxID=470 RepID=UPI0010216B11|nr:restriction endonuclease subunit S [Acinetobacter baumannii]QBC48668.1 restriction endonuclease subunit S [Acinetobacter baumannii]
MSDWVTVSLNEIAFINPTEKLAKGTLATKIGMDNLQPFSKKVSAQIQENYNGGMKFRNGDTIVARITPCLENGKTAYIDTLKDGEIGFGSTEYIVLRAKVGLSNSHFLYYFARSDTFRDVAIASMTGSSGRQRVQTEVVVNHTFELPTLPEQKAIASVLSSLDDKIDLLHRQNKTLEAMAETLFRQWFIEEAKEDWEYVELGSVVETSSGGTPSRKEMSYYENGSIHWVKSKELNGSFITETEEMITDEAVKKSSAKLLPAYSTLIAMYGATVGEYALITKTMTCNQAVCSLKENEAYPYTFIFMYVKNQKDELINQAVGSAQQNISQILIKKLPIPTCTARINEYHQLVIPWFKKMQLNVEQIQILEKLRDTLLPKLMSGEVRVQYQTEDVA